MVNHKELNQQHLTLKRKEKMQAKTLISFSAFSWLECVHVVLRNLCTKMCFL